MRTLVVIPAYNEASTIERVIAAIPAGFDYIVVNDGSHDETAHIAMDAGARVLHHAVNRGLGGALRTGFAFADEQGYDAVVTLDSDGQHDASEIPVLASAIEAGADVVIGRRTHTDMPLIRRAYNKLGAAITAILFGSPMLDTQSGYRAFKTAAVSRMVLRSSRMEISSEIIAEAHRLKLSVVQVPISVQYTEYSMSKGQSLVEGARTAWRLLLRSIS